MSYYNGEKSYTNLMWENGRQLASITTGGSTYTYSYDGDGIRTQKVVNGVTHTYVTQNGKVMRETIGTGATAKVLDFVYDNNGKPFALIYTNGTAEPDTYYYVLNLQGDVVALMTAERSIVARYTYNAWGELLSVTDEDGNAITSASHIANLNPIRYRGYYYDTETGFYYLQSRYYDPVNCRFISADTPEISAISAISISDTNLFAYCGNNPVNRADDGGEFWNIIVGAAVGVIAQYISDVVINLASGDSILEALVPSSTIADYAGAAVSGALAATGIGTIGSIAANAAIGGTTYLANAISDGKDPTWSGFIGSSLVGGASGMVGGRGLSASKVRGIKDTAKHILKTAVSPKKIAMYTAKKTACNKAVATTIIRTAASVFAGNGLNMLRNHFIGES